MAAIKKKLFNSKRKQLEQDIAHITAEMYKRNVELSETNKTLSLLKMIDDSLLEADSTLAHLANNMLSLIQTQTGYEALAFYIKNHNTPAYLLSESPTGAFGADLLTKAREVFTDWDSSGTNVREVTIDGKFPRVHLYELRTRGEVSLIFVVGFSSPDVVLLDHEKILVERLRDSVGLVLESKILADENKRVLAQLKRSNDKLKALDEAKDEFISMASHQLRTPLTSIKGYLSMVLEGDVGDVLPQQKDMLNTAYTSAQRMVYLISDLLNVSRLQTGKFMIETVECYLPDVVSEELAQLKEAIAAKNITVLFKKPSSFPSMSLDETKIRQVIMNFTDNALYYTPSGGEVTVALSATARSVSFTVKDNGIGVPKAEQHKLFGKFFRAGNAKKARPDGTGLGLFMAKKVIVASGGAILFKSKEGKGSTFGFTFPRE